MRFDVIIPTYNRAQMLVHTLKSLLAADPPAGVEVHITVADNNSTDCTKQTVEEWMPKFDGRLHYVFERRQGRSYALNAGIEATSGDWIGMIDDDEEVSTQWYKAVAEYLQRDDVDFVGGPYLPNWSMACPDWLPEEYRGVVGWVQGSDAVIAFGNEYEGQLMGGNAVIKRAVLKGVGSYSTNLGRTNKGLLSCEDEEMHHRLLESKARGLFLPQMIIYHYVPPERLTKKYFRRWCLWRGVSKGLMDQKRPQTVIYLGGVPRYLFGRAAHGLISRFRGLLPGAPSSAQSFAGELACWDLAGFLYGKHFYRVVDAEGR